MTGADWVYVAAAAFMAAGFYGLQVLAERVKEGLRRNNDRFDALCTAQRLVDGEPVSVTREQVVHAAFVLLQAASRIDAQERPEVMQ